MLEVDCSILTPYDVLKTSGHVDRFTDFMVKDTKTGDFYRADHLVKAFLERRMRDRAATASEIERAETILAQIDGYNQEGLQSLITSYDIRSDTGNPVSPVTSFNLMFATEIGPTGYLRGFLRPETAQGQFTNFRRLLEFNSGRMPFASASIGKSFRNEISPRSGLLRVREFLMAEIEHFVHPDRKQHPKFASVSACLLPLLSSKEQQAGRSTPFQISAKQAVSEGIVNNETLAYFLVRIKDFLLAIGIKADRLRFRQHLPNEMAHYASDCWDAEIQNSYGWIECVGCADRAAFDLTQHTARTKERLVAMDRLEHAERVTTLRPVINRRDIGVKFKHASKPILQHLDSLSGCDLERIFASAAPVYTFVEDGAEYSLEKGLFSVEKCEEMTHVREYVPNVIEPSFGIGRILYSLLEHSYWNRGEGEERTVLSFAPSMAPQKVAILPLSNDSSFAPMIEEFSGSFRKAHVAFVVDDSSASIGKRYARNDEIGIPFYVTIDFQSLLDETVTVRERDSMAQLRVPNGQVVSLIRDFVGGKCDWESASQRYPKFIQQEISAE